MSSPEANDGGRCCSDDVGDLCLVEMRRAFARTETKLASLTFQVLVAALLVVALLRGGSSYFVCPAMGAVSSAPCCEHCDAAGDEQAPAANRAPCCAHERVRFLPSATAASGIDVPDAPLIATIVSVSFDVLAPTRALERDRAHGRTTMPPNDTRAPRSMVFLL